jgi:hypothetical protein
VAENTYGVAIVGVGPRAIAVAKLLCDKGFTNLGARRDNHYPRLSVDIPVPWGQPSRAEELSA